MNEPPPEAAAALDELRLAAVRRQFDLLPSSDLPQLALRALKAGFDSPSLRELAGELRPTWADCGPLFDRALHDLGITAPTPEEAAHSLARHYAAQILSGALTPYEGARKIWWKVADRFPEEQEFAQRHIVFRDLAYLWEDYERRRPALEQQTRDEAAKLLQRNA